MIQVTVVTGGQTFKSTESDAATVDELRDMIYEDLENMGKFKMELEDGGWLLLGTSSIENATIVIKDV